MRLFGSIILPFLFLNLTIQPPVDAQNLSDHKWENRVLIVQSYDTASNKFIDQMNQFEKANAEMKERKLVLYQIFGDQYRMIDFQISGENQRWKSVKLGSKYIKNKNTPFKVTLIGLDGGRKLEDTEILTKSELFRIIDSMPMRKQEMRVKRRNTDSQKN